MQAAGGGGGAPLLQRPAPGVIHVAQVATQDGRRLRSGGASAAKLEDRGAGLINSLRAARLLTRRPLLRAVRTFSSSVACSCSASASAAAAAVGCTIASAPLRLLKSRASETNEDVQQAAGSAIRTGTALHCRSPRSGCAAHAGSLNCVWIILDRSSVQAPRRQGSSASPTATVLPEAQGPAPVAACDRNGLVSSGAGARNEPGRPPAGSRRDGGKPVPSLRP